MIKSTTARELKKWLDAGEAILVDVRQPEEYAQASIEGAVLIPLATVSINKIPSFEGKKLVIQCRSGARSRAACEIVSTEIPDLEVYNLEGGILAWAQEGYDIQK